jgi:hypothetical protein
MKKSLLLLPFGVALAQPVIEPNFATLPTGKFGVAHPPC